MGTGKGMHPSFRLRHSPWPSIFSVRAQMTKKCWYL